MSDTNNNNNNNNNSSSSNLDNLSTAATSIPTSTTSTSTVGNVDYGGGERDGGVQSSAVISDEKESKKQQMWFHEITEKLQLQSQLNDSLKEKNLQLLQQHDHSEIRIESMRQELDAKNTQIQSLDNRFKELKKLYAQKEEETKRLRFMNDELLEWKETHKINEDDYIRMKEVLRAKDANIDSLTIQLEHAVNRNAMLSESLREIGERTSIFDRDESFNISSASKQLLDYQKMLAYHKIKSIEEKYATIKNINLGYQKAIQELSLENGKYKYTLEALIKNQNRKND
ncbi:hypothetical protein SAMD00019534_006650 [Acytostelium subglobosum LB1]|uniref:hypothetical protein n=1 Tax=Acytostelium subglobosum LB1 TaxID=1410327 RepID=UPI000644A2A7|nr:hypothetical protein SAMD00019534_006650 [Acytostelium subglobosum LB1]GAM17490.1 hypothetical protein SAMD00019534_006650 [Acytostelium subglobosum LB1]|eukprot:XP_012759552.1 hypothetical protein SAMD00019534_006650 [Acytostelium subglobosum LB1]